MRAGDRWTSRPAPCFTRPPPLPRTRMRPTIGIDFGTTNSVVATLRPDGSVDRPGPSRGGDLPLRPVLWTDGARGATPTPPAPRRSRPISRTAGQPADPVDEVLPGQRSFRETRIHGRAWTLEALVAAVPAATCWRPSRRSCRRADRRRPPRALRRGNRGRRLWRGAAARRLRRRRPAGREVALEPAAAGYRFASSAGRGRRRSSSAISAAAPATSPSCGSSRGRRAG